jgi:hypothetical protein
MLHDPGRGKPWKGSGRIEGLNRIRGTDCNGTAGLGPEARRQQPVGPKERPCALGRQRGSSHRCGQKLQPVTTFSWLQKRHYLANGMRWHWLFRQVPEPWLFLEGSPQSRSSNASITASTDRATSAAYFAIVVRLDCCTGGKGGGAAVGTGGGG